MNRPYAASYGSSPNLLIEYFMEAWQGPGRKGRLRRKHRRDITCHKPPACLPQSAAGAGEDRFGGKENTAATAKERYAP